jgi:hypothetical protein
MLKARQWDWNSCSSSHSHLRVVVVDLKVDEVLTLDEALPATVVALDVAEEVLTEMEIEAVRVLEATGPDTDEVDEPAVVVLSDPDVEGPDAPAVAELDDPDVDEPGEPVLAVFQYAARRDCTAPTLR